jgi:hypothetical protein
MAVSPQIIGVHFVCVVLFQLIIGVVSLLSLFLFFLLCDLNIDI